MEGSKDKAAEQQPADDQAEGGPPLQYLAFEELKDGCSDDPVAFLANVQTKTKGEWKD